MPNHTSEVVTTVGTFSSPEPPGPLNRWRLGTRLRGTGGSGDENAVGIQLAKKQPRSHGSLFLSREWPLVAAEGPEGKEVA